MFHEAGYSPSQEIKAAQWTNVYVQGIPIHATKDECIRAFSKLVCTELSQNTGGKYATKTLYYGQIIITSARYWLWNWSTKHRNKSRGNKGCFNFETHKQAKKAIEILNGFDLDLYLKRNYFHYKQRSEGNENDEYYKKPVVFAAPNRTQLIATVSPKSGINYFDNIKKCGQIKGWFQVRESDECCKKSK